MEEYQHVDLGVGVSGLVFARTLQDKGINSFGNLEYTSIRVAYHAEEIDGPAHWVYVPGEAISFHRILCRKNFIPASCGYWTEGNLKREAE